jgi:hypothetical protein
MKIRVNYFLFMFLISSILFAQKTGNDNGIDYVIPGKSYVQQSVKIEKQIHLTSAKKILNNQLVIPSAVPEIIYYKFNETGTQQTVNLAVPGAGTSPAPITGHTMGGVGQFGSALLSSGGAGGTDFVNSGWGANLGTGSWTVSTWFSNMYEATNELHYLFGDNNSTFRCFTGGIAGAGNLYLRGAGMNDVLVSNIGSAEGPQPTVVHFVYDSSVPNISVYVNGSFVNSVAQPALNISSSGSLRIGGYSGEAGTGTIPLNSKMDEFRFYNRALTDDEIAVTWNMELGGGTGTINLVVNPLYTGSVTGGGTFNFGSSVTVKAIPYSGYVFNNWTENGSVVSTLPSYTFTVAANRNLIANFQSVQYSITTSCNPSNTGRATGDGSFEVGTLATVNAIPNIGHEFVNWTEQSVVVSTTANYSFVINSNRNLTANFQAIRYTLTTTSNPSSSGSTTGSGTYTIGQNITFSATPSNGYKFTNWRIGNILISTSQSYTFKLTEEVLSTLGLLLSGGGSYIVTAFFEKTVDVKDLDLGVPTTYTLSQNYPNPFNPSTTIRYGLPKESFVKIVIYNLLGSEVERLVNQIQSEGYHEVKFEANKYNSGIYFYKIESEGYTSIRKMLLMK